MSLPLKHTSRCRSVGYRHAPLSSLIDFLPAHVVCRTLSANTPRLIRRAIRHCCCSCTGWHWYSDMINKTRVPLLWILRFTLWQHGYNKVRKKWKSFRLQTSTLFLRPSSLISLSVGKVLHSLVNTSALFNSERSERGCLYLKYHTWMTHSRLFGPRWPFHWAL